MDLTIAEVDCVEAAMTCMDEGVDGYPSIKLYKDGNVLTDYFFARSLDRMKRFLSDKLVDIDQIEPNTIGVYTLNDLSFTKFVEKSDEVPVLVKFFIPGCEHCKTFQEVYDELGKKNFNSLFIIVILNFSYQVHDGRIWRFKVCWSELHGYW